MKTPISDLSPTARPEVIQPRATIEQVFTWPTTVLDTGPVWAMIKNWDMLIMQAQRADWVKRMSAEVAYAGLGIDDEGYI